MIRTYERHRQTSRNKSAEGIVHGRLIFGETRMSGTGQNEVFRGRLGLLVGALI